MVVILQASRGFLTNAALLDLRCNAVEYPIEFHGVIFTGDTGKVRSESVTPKVPQR